MLRIKNAEPLFPSSIADKIIEHLSDEQTMFVFPTDIAATSWAEWIITHPEQSGTTAVPLERFTAWDTFKATLINAKEKNKKSIPALLRKLFVRNLIAENTAAVKNGTPLFTTIITPEFADGALPFTDWISRMLPSLRLWHTKYEAWLGIHGGTDSDPENRDYLMLYTRYSRYLEQHALFEPSWLEPDFSGRGITCIIFYPELLEDFSDYGEIFAADDHVKLYTLPAEAEGAENEADRPEVNFFSNARTELRFVALSIRKLVAEHCTDWTSIAVSVPDIETWRPYMEREFKLYGIPYVFRAGEKLTENSAGRIFRELQDCKTEQFSYDSVRTLLLDRYVPWREPSLNENLVRYGNEFKCICPYNEGNREIDVWEAALSPSNTGDRSELERAVYRTLRNDIEELCTSRTFSGVRAAWFIFRVHFLDETKFTGDADLIIGRCLTELSALIDIEKEFLEPENISVPSPFSFFINEIEQKTYQKQQQKAGVSVFPYKLAACAPYAVQFVLNANQKALTVGYRSLSFLNREKRIQLELDDDDSASDSFVRLYAEKNRCVFSGCEQTFGGFAIPFSYLKKEDKKARSTRLEKELALLEPYDFISAERRWYVEKSLFPAALSPLQKRGFAVWKKACADDGTQLYRRSSALPKQVRRLLCTNRSRNTVDSGTIHIAQTDLNNFFPCPRKWVFSQILRFREDTLDTDLMKPYDAGNINHRILELFMNSYKESGEPLPVTIGETELFAREEDIRAHVLSYAEQAFNSADMEFRSSPLVMTVLESQKDSFADVIMSFLHTFCAAAEFGGNRVLSVEKSMDGRCGTDDWMYTGRIDCILSSGTGDVSIVDYKTSKCPPAPECIAADDGTITDFQIPVYVMLWNISQNGKDGRSISNALFYTITTAAAQYVVQENPPGRARSVPIREYQKTLDALSTYAARFVRRVQANDFAVTGDFVEAYRDCPDCRFRAVCRTTYTVSGRPIPRTSIRGASGGYTE
jgi:hypothetical protein